MLMKRAMALVTLVVIVACGVGYYLPAGKNSVVVLYRQTPDSQGAQETTSCISPVFCQNGNWLLSLDRIILTADRPSWLQLSKPKSRLSMHLLLQGGRPIDRTAPALKVQAVDETGRKYAGTTDKCDLLCEHDPPVWRFVLRFPPLAADAKAITIRAELDRQRLVLPKLSLP